MSGTSKHGYVWAACVLLVLLVVGAMTLRRWHCRPPAASTLPRSPPNEFAEQWLTAVARDDCDGALRAAARLVNTAELPPAPPRYSAIASAEGIQARYPDLPFNEWDYRAWRHAYRCRELALKLQDSHAPDEALSALFEGIVGRVSPEEPRGEEPAWPMGVWERGYGLCDRLAWLFAELAYQLDWETQVVYLQTSENGSDSPHSICEARRGAEVWLVDPLSRVLHPVSVDRAAADGDLTAAWWRQHPEWQQGLRFCRFWTPSMPADYCPRNQVLHARLRAALGSRCPRFGDDPVQRLERYRNLRVAALGTDIHYAMGLWFFPFRMLRLQLEDTEPTDTATPTVPTAPDDEKDAQ